MGVLDNDKDKGKDRGEVRQKDDDPPLTDEIEGLKNKKKKS